MITLRDYANQKSISYEAVRRQIKRYSSELEGHITKQGRTRFLDDEAVSFLEEHRQDNAVSVQNNIASLAKLEEENKMLLQKIAALQEMIISRDETIKQLQADKMQMLEDKNRKRNLWQRLFG